MAFGAPPRGSRMRPHPLAGALPRLDEPTHDPRDPINLSVRNDDGTPIGLHRYCQIVTPSWDWDAPHLRLVDYVLDQVVAGNLKRVIFEMPPRHGKTEKATIRFAPYLLELDPTARIIHGAYNSKLARKFSRKMRRIARARPALHLSKERSAAEDWETEEGGGVRAAGVGEGITGLGANYVLIDDPVKSRAEAESPSYRDAVWEWYTDDLTTRLEPNAAIVLSMTRWHEDDIVGRIKASEDAASWIIITLPALAEPGDILGRQVGEALWPARYPVATLEARRRVLGARSFSALFQQHPTPAKGLIIDTGAFRYYTTPDHPIVENGRAIPFLPPVYTTHWQSWDMSFKDTDGSNPVAGLMFSRLNADVYVRDAEHGQMEFTAALAAVLRMTRKWPAASLKLIEDKANGSAIISALRRKVPGLVAVEPEGGKIARAWAVTPMIASGNVWLPHPSIAPWVLALVNECARFPFGTTDDYVDALTQGLKRAEEQIQAGLGAPPPNGGDDDWFSEANDAANRRY